ncbi:hypothetical protein [Solimonas marina]|uniref:Cobalamin ABC transporter n=1 Tax=Solimonas marina TaxID=2714601 RepID=A0A969W7I6_9GAMM|nr:hypothetical protein [Solimonas marina]NKF21010.1 hypothetical protein [Solimonas marina]
MTTKPYTQIAIFVLLALLMLSTRYAHFAQLPDASWAVFFAGGFYFRGRGGLAVFAALMLEAVAIDAAVIHYLGVSNFCVTAAYPFLVPTHGALWLAGAWTRRHYRWDASSALQFALAAVIAVHLAYAISNASFYWLGGRYAQPNVGEYLQRFVRYYPHFMEVTLGYLAILGVLHLAAASQLPQLRPAGAAPRSA